jgi:predicted GH43/DUF377 family glycosyl hydrolase
METKESFRDSRIYPGIVQQTKWPCKFFNFGKAKTKEVSFFNCGLVERPDGLWLITRRSRNERGVRIGYNDLMAFRLDDKLNPIYGVSMKFQRFFDKEHFEDPRAIFHKGITYISSCNFVVVNNGRGWTGAHQVLNLIHQVDSKNTWVAEKRIDPVYGLNGPAIGKDTGPEKNWLWFFHQDALHLVYQASPHIVARFSKDGKFEQEYKTFEKEPQWNWGIIRGGTPPVLTEAGDEYLTFFHSRLADENHHWRYYMGAYTFESQPPFRITRMTSAPLLAGSYDDPWSKQKPLVVFPCGSRLKNGKWLITLGVNDLDSAWIEIPHEDLEPMLSEVFVPTAKKSFFFDKGGNCQTSRYPLLTTEGRNWPREPLKPARIESILAK